MKLFKLYVVIGFILLIIGIVFDFGFVRTPDRFIETVENNHNVWSGYVYNLMRFYLVVLGMLNIAYALFTARAGAGQERINRINFCLLNGGATLLFTGLVWGAYISPSNFTNQAPYFLEVAGLCAIIASIIIKMVRLISGTANYSN